MGIGIWALLIGAAYLLGTLVIAPMIADASGIRPGVYSLPASQSETVVAAESTASNPPKAATKLQQAPASSVAQDPPKPRRKRTRRSHSNGDERAGQGRRHSRDMETQPPTQTGERANASQPHPADEEGGTLVQPGDKESIRD